MVATVPRGSRLRIVLGRARALVLACCLAPVMGCGGGTDRPPPGYGLDDDALVVLCAEPGFAASVLPTLHDHCTQCHRPGATAPDLHDYDALMSAGGNLIVPEDCAGSLLFQVVTGLTDLQMPPSSYEPLTLEQIGCICAWIEAGAQDD